MTIFLYSAEEFSESVNLIKIGDICLIYSDKTINFIIIKESFHDEIRNGVIHVTYQALLPEDKFLAKCDRIIFSFDGNEKRHGDKTALCRISSLFNSSICKRFLSDVINILDYKEDRIDIGCYRLIANAETTPVQIKINIHEQNYEAESAGVKSIVNEEVLQCSNEEKDNKKITEEQKEETIFAPEAYLFFQYLDERGKKYWIENYTKVHRMRELFTGLRKSNRSSFSNALRKFDAENGRISIYSMM
jgi:hypothetical protein